MTNNKHYERLASILSTIEKEGISTAYDLKAPKNKALWDELYFATQDFINYYALASKTSKNKKGDIVPGNTDKVKFLTEEGGMELYDIQMDILLHVIKKMDYVLAQSPVAKKTSYAYKIVNNEVNSMLRKLPPVVLVPWDTPINSDTNEDGAVLTDIVGDDTYNPERLYFERETINELKKELKAKKAREQAEKRKTILNEITILNKRPSEVLCRLACTHLSMKPRELAGLIIDKGCELAYAEIIFEVANQNHIELSEIRNIIVGYELKAKSVKADTNSAEQVAGQISRLVYRADKRLGK